MTRLIRTLLLSSALGALGALAAAGAQGAGAAAAQAPAEDPTAFVDPMIGTGGEGHTFPGATLPNGMVQLSPSNARDGWKWCAGYHWTDTVIDGFAHTHLSGAGMSGLGDILLAPARAPVTAPGPLDRPGEGYRSRFSHQSEHAEPGYYRVHLDDPDVEAELTATLRTGFHRYSFAGPRDRYVIIDPVHGLTDHTYKSGLEIVSDREIRGYKRAISQATGDRAVYFVARFSRPFVRAGLTEADSPVAGERRDGEAVRGFVQFGPQDDTVEVAVAISFTSYAAAEANFDAEAKGKTFDEVRRAAHEAWRQRLSQITIDEPSPAKKRTFYTAEYHQAIAPNLISDVTGDYALEGTVRHSSIPQFSNFSNWDTHRALHPLLTITDPALDGKIVASMVSRYTEAHEVLPIWEGLGHDSAVMIGYSIVSPIADAVLKGVPGVDPQAAYAAIRASAFDTTRNSNVYDANGMAGYLTYGFVPADVASSVSKTAEQNYEDWVIGQVARKLGRTADADLFARRATGWRQLYDSKTGYLLPREADGRTPAMRTDDWGDLTHHYVSGNIWAYSAYSPQDMEAAIRLHGGREAYARWLEGVFTDTKPIGGQQHVDISGFIGRYGHGDEPGHEMTYLFNLAGQPWRTQYYVNRVIREMYSDKPDGIVNNDDLGQMSAWYVLSTLGFYPVTPGDLTYQIGAPYFPRAVVSTGSGRKLVIEAEGLSDSNIYVQSASLDGRPLSRTYLTHAQIMAGGVLRFVMGPTPNRAWGARPQDASLGAFDDRAPVAAPQRAPWAPYDPDADPRFSATRTVRLAADAPGAQIRFTTDGTDPTPRSPLYTGAFSIDRDTVVKAATFDKRLGRSTVFARRYVKSLLAGLAPGFPRIAVSEKDMPYGRPDGAMLIDGIEGSWAYADTHWSGRTGDITATIDLGASKPAGEVTLGYLDDAMNGIMPPRAVEVFAGDDPAALTEVARATVAPWTGIRKDAARLSLRLPPRPYRYYRVRVLAQTLPTLLSPPGKPAWLFLDEINLR